MTYDDLVQLKNPDGSPKYPMLSRECPSQYSHQLIDPSEEYYLEGPCVKCGESNRGPKGRVAKPVTLELLLDLAKSLGAISVGFKFREHSQDLPLVGSEVSFDVDEHIGIVTGGKDYVEALTNAISESVADYYTETSEEAQDG